MVVSIDEYLLRKIEFHAGTTNIDILSDRERETAKILIFDTEKVLLSLDREIERLAAEREKVAERLSRFRTAVAPHKRLPPEVLADIFICSLNDRPVKCPPQLSKSPWVFRKVCSSWRQVALSEPRLWNTIRIARTEMDAELFSRLVALINYVAPPPFPLSFQMNIIAHKGAIEQLILPNLSRIEELNLVCDVPTFMRLCEAPHKERLCLKAMSLEFFIWGPTGWLDATEAFSRSTIFRRTHTLEALDVSFRKEYLPGNGILDLPVSWSRLTTLHLSRIRPLTIAHIHHILRQCSVLVDLSADLVYGPNVPETINVTESLQLPCLLEFELQGALVRPHSLVDLRLPWDQLTRLNLSELQNLTLMEVHHIFSHCAHIEDLFIVVDEGQADLTVPSEIFILPMLKDLDITTLDGSILRHFMTPALTTLFLRSPLLPVSELSDMIFRSSCSLSLFYYNGRRCSPIECPNIPTLLALMTSVMDFNMPKLVLDHEPILRIASGDLLPRAMILALRTRQRNLIPFVDVLERRRKAEGGRLANMVDGLSRHVNEYHAREGDSEGVHDGLRRLVRFNEEYRMDVWLRMAHWRGRAYTGDSSASDDSDE